MSKQQASRTLRHWRRREKLDGLAAHPRGRPPAACDVPTRNELIGFLHHVTGPAVGLPALQALFTDVPVGILENLLWRYRRVWRRRYRRQGYRLTWHVPGAVWAMDFSDAPYLIDGVYMYLFAVRDLASHYQIAWIPVPDLRAETVLPLLEQLFEEHGAPLVLKSDNGSAFIAELLTEFLATKQVSQLFSPARRPQYNGALERSNGVLKTYTGLHAIREGHPFRWTSDDVEQARQLANTISRPWGRQGSTPQETWQAREPITAEQRGAFIQSVQEQLPRAAEDQGLPSVALLSPAQHRMVSRMAISRVLEQSGHLTMKRAPRRKRRRQPATTTQPKPSSELPTAQTAPSPTPRAPSAPQPDSREPSPQLSANVPTHPNTPARPTGPARPAIGKPLDTPPEKDPAALLARSPERVTMPVGRDAPLDDGKDVQTRGSPPSERSIQSWLRRLDTLLLLAKKAADISGV
jgi:transposase InsO family protein